MPDDSTPEPPAPPEPAGAAPLPAAHPRAAQPRQEPAIECPCGDTHAVTAAIARLIAAKGPAAVMRGPAGAWHVPRVYAAAHQVKAADLPRLAETYGFELA